MTNATRVCARCGADISHLRRDARYCRGCPHRPRPVPIAQRPCVVCGKPFAPPQQRSLCCSRVCTNLRLNRIYAAEAKKTWQTSRPCPGCGETFKPWRSDQKYCTGECGNRRRARLNYKPADLSPRVCACCGTTFTPKQSDSVVCSRECSRRLSYARYRADRVAQAVAWARANPERRAAIANQAKIKRRAIEQDGPGVTSNDWLKTIRRFKGRCAYCGGVEGGIHMEHVVPLARGGRHAIGNVVPACKPCNLSKGSKLLIEWRRWQKEVIPHGRRDRKGPRSDRTPDGVLGARSGGCLTPRSNGACLATSIAASSS